MTNNKEVIVIDKRLQNDIFFYVDRGLDVFWAGISTLTVILLSPFWVPLFMIGYIANKWWPNKSKNL